MQWIQGMKETNIVGNLFQGLPFGIICILAGPSYESEQKASNADISLRYRRLSMSTDGVL